MNNEKGTVYLVQPAELVGTNRYKIGCSAKNDLERCKKGYKKGTRFMNIQECDDPFGVERKLKIRFRAKFKLVAGKEYFEGNEEDIKREFIDVVSNHASLQYDEKSDEKCDETYDEKIDNTYFTFTCDGVSVNPQLPKSKATFTPPYTNSWQEYEIDCRGNFNKEEQLLIKEYKIQSLEELLRSEKISAYDKSRALTCYKYVRDRNELMGIEPFNGNRMIQFGKYLLVIRIADDKSITFIQSCGIKTHDDYHTIQMGM